MQLPPPTRRVLLASATPAGANSPSTLYSRAATLAASSASAFPYLLLVASAAALRNPATFLWFEPHVTPAIAAVMLLMGSTLTMVRCLGMHVCVCVCVF